MGESSSSESIGVHGEATGVSATQLPVFGNGASELQGYLDCKTVSEARVLVAELCRDFYTLGWMSGTGGSITIKIHDDFTPKRDQLMVMSPSGVQKERMVPDDMYVLSSDGFILSSGTPKPYPHKPPKCTECAPIFVKRCILLDTEGTATPLAFVTDVLFTYASDHVRKNLAATYDTEQTQVDINLLRSQVQLDLEQGVVGAVPIPPDYAGKELVIVSLVAIVESMIRADKKATALKLLQGHIWRTGFQCGELVGVVFDDVSEALEKWHASGIKSIKHGIFRLTIFFSRCTIYSSGSREAQQLLFAKLENYLYGFFDTTVGHFANGGCPSDMFFIMDFFQGALAATAAGLHYIIKRMKSEKS